MSVILVCALEQLLSHHAAVLLGEESETGRFLTCGAGELIWSQPKRGAQSEVPPS